MTTFDVTLDRVGAQAREVHVGRALLAVLVALFWSIGWLARKAVLAVAYMAVAVRTGYRDAGRTVPRPVEGAG